MGRVADGLFEIARCRALLPEGEACAPRHTFYNEIDASGGWVKVLKCL